MTVGTGLPPHLVRYWTRGEGARKIRWDSPEGGDFNRCRVQIQKAVVDGGGKPLSDPVLSGLCATLHKIATGAPPGKGPVESAGKD